MRRGGWGYGSRPTGEQFLEAQKGLHVPSREENLRMLGGQTPELAVSGRRLMALMVDAKLLRAPVEIESVLAPEPLAEIERMRARRERPGARNAHATRGPLDHSHSRVAQAHGPAHPAGLRRDPQHGQHAVSRAAGRARGGGRQPQAAGAGDVPPAEHARVPAAQGRFRGRAARDRGAGAQPRSHVRRADR